MASENSIEEESNTEESWIAKGKGLVGNKTQTYATPSVLLSSKVKRFNPALPSLRYELYLWLCTYSHNYKGIYVWCQ